MHRLSPGRRIAAAFSILLNSFQQFQSELTIRPLFGEGCGPAADSNAVR